MFSYERLIKLLVDRKMTKTQLYNCIGGSKATIAKISKNENVSMESLGKICECLQCRLEDIVEYIPTNPKPTSKETITLSKEQLEQIIRDASVQILRQMESKAITAIPKREVLTEVSTTNEVTKEIKIPTSATAKTPKSRRKKTQ